MTETKISRQSYEQLAEAAKPGTTPEAILDKALEQFIQANE